MSTNHFAESSLYTLKTFFQFLWWIDQFFFLLFIYCKSYKPKSVLIDMNISISTPKILIIELGIDNIVHHELREDGTLRGFIYTQRIEATHCFVGSLTGEAHWLWQLIDLGERERERGRKRERERERWLTISFPLSQFSPHWRSFPSSHPLTSSPSHPTRPTGRRPTWQQSHTWFQVWRRAGPQEVVSRHASRPRLVSLCSGEHTTVTR